MWLASAIDIRGTPQHKTQATVAAIIDYYGDIVIRDHRIASFQITLGNHQITQ